LALPRLAPRLQSLPPILHRQNQNSLPSCSKGSRGLSVLPRVGSIFTASSISLGPWPRQWGCRYAIRAGRNLPDKEFRYLRTVIVTAAVYRGFEHRAGVRPYTSSCDFAESCVFSKQSQPPFLCDPQSLREQVPSRPKAHLIPKLRCHFAEFLSQGAPTRLGILSPPT
jgi:hypothetical protein